MKKKVPSWIILTCICLVVGGSLGAVNEATWELIAQRAAEQAEARPRDFIEAVCSGVYEATPEEMTEAYADDLTKIRRPELGERELDAVRRRCGYLYRAGCIERVPDLAAWADGSFLKAARESLKRDS